ncbi:SelB C-terminal domain-containing protein [Leucobacter sp. CSA1]|uniref:SelB C-terminal domain-containing protein n=1 Tax=Leucobacter chromiisoli TaxID=2796471 RepID=A0A934UTR0_9MICO|nr:selenocysteine-specific translation elongation factor [Leucobacter chromiisoli]MBK0417621.1 SelB C-terminal domain-containing protein [Leucobacter chromiisoli]
MYVVATAGHVDHGKSTLVRALTGMEPDRLAEEQRRGLTIDLGFAWTALPSGREVAFVDVPGHERFIANMLAGVGPAPVVCFVVAADQGWQAQSTDHRDALAALGVAHGLVVISRADRASPQRLAETRAEVRARLSGTPLERAPLVTVALPEGAGSRSTGLDEFARRLDEVLAGTPAPDPRARLRLWVDRSFSITGSGTVVTGSLTAGALRRGDQLQIVGEAGTRTATVRGLHSRGSSETVVEPNARVAVNLRETSTREVGRGDALIAPGSWPVVATVDVRRTTGADLAEAPQQLVAHIGTAATPARLRPFDGDHARLVLQRSLPLGVGDRLVLRNPGSRSVLAGALILDVDPPELRRRGDGARRAAALASRPAAGDPAAEVARRGAVRPERLRWFGLTGLESAPAGVAEMRGAGTWWVHPPTLEAWAATLRRAVERKLREEPLAPGLTEGAAAELLLGQDPPLPDRGLLPLVVRAARLESERGALRPPGHRTDLGEAEQGVAELERRLGARPFAAPEADELTALRLGPQQLAAAERAGRLLRLGGGVILLPQAPALAMRRLSALEQPFTASRARQALDTTRRVAIPLLEHLDSRGWTRRVDGTRRSVVR